jgi:hypothetical protein
MFYLQHLSGRLTNEFIMFHKYSAKKERSIIQKLRNDITNPNIIFYSFPFIQYVIKNKLFKITHFNQDYFYKKYILEDNENVLRWFIENGFYKPSHIISYAIDKNKFELAKMFYQNKYPINEYLLITLFEKVSMQIISMDLLNELFDYFYYSPIIIEILIQKYTIARIFDFYRLDFLLFLESKNVFHYHPLTIQNLHDAIHTNNLPIIKWVHSKISMYSVVKNYEEISLTTLYNLPIINNRLQIVKFLHRNKYQMNDDIYYYIIHYNRFSILKYILKNTSFNKKTNLSFTNLLYGHCIQCKKWKMCKWLILNGYIPSKQMITSLSISKNIGIFYTIYKKDRDILTPDIIDILYRKAIEKNRTNFIGHLKRWKYIMN